MAKEKLKSIIFCQGDKKELEEITGDKYEYINLEKINEVAISSSPKMIEKYQGTTASFFHYEDRTRSRARIRKGLCRIAMSVDADAFIHYKERNVERTIAGCEGFHYHICGAGTPVMKVCEED